VKKTPAIIKLKADIKYGPVHTQVEP
jgi:hypothetical protein